MASLLDPMARTVFSVSPFANITSETHDGFSRPSSLHCLSHYVARLIQHLEQQKKADFMEISADLRVILIKFT